MNCLSSPSFPPSFCFFLHPNQRFHSFLSSQFLLPLPSTPPCSSFSVSLQIGAQPLVLKILFVCASVSAGLWRSVGQCPWRPEEGIRCRGAAVTCSGCELPDLSTGNQTWIPCKSSILLAAELSHYPCNIKSFLN